MLYSHLVAKVLRSHPGVLNLHLATDITEKDTDIPTFTMLYKISSGPVEERHYGLNLARAIGFPQRFLETAEYISSELEEHNERRKENSESRKLLKRRQLILKLHETLKQLQDSGMDDEVLGSYMRRLQVEFIDRMDQIQQEGQDEESEVIEVSD